MTQDDLKRYSVIIEDGSGCLFQPLTTEYTYIITAKHLFYNEIEDDQGQIKKVLKEDGSEILIKRQIRVEHVWHYDIINFKKILGENFFIHEYADVAILKIDYKEGYNSINVLDNFENESNFFLCGFPNTFRSGRPGDEYRTNEVITIGPSGNYSNSAQLFGTLNQHDIAGMSGGGILKVNQDAAWIIGIQSKMASEQFPVGQIGFVPISFAKEIIEYKKNKDKLFPLLPPYFSSFKFLREEIFKIQPVFLSESKIEKLTKILLAKASEIQNSNLTPITIKEFFKDNLPTIYHQDKELLYKKRIWILWLELLTALNIAKDQMHCLNDLSTILKKVRLFYSNTNSDYWVEHFHELHLMNYSGLETHGLVVVASNATTSNTHLLDIKVPAIITRVNNAKADFELHKIGQRIDESTEFPLDKYKFAHISIFKDGALNELTEDFNNETIPNCINILRELYGAIIPN